MITEQKPTSRLLYQSKLTISCNSHSIPQTPLKIVCNLQEYLATFESVFFSYEWMRWIPRPSCSIIIIFGNPLGSVRPSAVSLSVLATVRCWSDRLIV
ncbi:hypothetical protein JTE90_002239 [Oedothorax gibbosus]|uniref:Uncharacterized protein n=1 Tax=Oedothorax gibbosus TaxID=931172 RepID=A0AAV6V5R2_9ARAC|nr:hypothetical protein JTE90_002239 [Oedothorax gibbosus]